MQLEIFPRGRCASEVFNKAAGNIYIYSDRNTSIFSFKSVYFSLPRRNQDSEFWVIHGLFEGVMLGIVGDPIDPGGLAYSSLTQDEDVDVFLVIHGHLQIQ